MNPVEVEFSDGNSLARVTFSGGRGNVLTMALAERLDGVLADLATRGEVKAVILTGAGSSFSFGASVEEHLPEHARGMLKIFHRIIRRLVRFPMPIVAAVRGSCLGGGLELTLACTRILAASDARLGAPEIRLAVFAPAASVLLPERIGRPAADELLLTGRTVAAAEALALGLIDVIDDDPVGHAERWARLHILTLPGAAIRTAYHASRDWYAERICSRLDELEDFYLDEVANSADAREGLTAFIEKRAPRYRHG